MIRAIVYGMALLVLGCETTSKTSATSQSRAQLGIAVSSEDGSSIEQAVVIIGAPNSSSGMGAGSNWLAQRYPGYKRRTQTVITVGQRTYEQFEIETADGQTMTLYFDITVFFQERR